MKRAGHLVRANAGMGECRPKGALPCLQSLRSFVPARALAEGFNPEGRKH